jgi:hypothetical protein
MTGREITRIIVYGDSHIGAFKEGWERVRGAFPGVEVAFFGLPHPYVRRIGLRPDGSLVVRPAEGGVPDETIELAERILGRTEIDAAAADMVIWAGYAWPAQDLARLLGATAVDGVFAADRPGLMSAAAFDACIGALAARAAPPPRWAARFGQRLVLALRANPSETCLTQRRTPAIAPWQRMAAGGSDARAAFAALAERVERVASGLGVRCLPQPAETLAPSGLTADAWSRGSRRIVRDRAHPSRDFAHMNAAYGALCLTALLGGGGGQGRSEGDPATGAVAGEPV